MCLFQENVYLYQCKLSCQIKMKARKVMFEAGAVSCYICFYLEAKMKNNHVWAKTCNSQNY